MTENEFVQRIRLGSLIRYALDQMGGFEVFPSEELAEQMYRHGGRVPDLLGVEIGRHVMDTPKRVLDD